MTVVVKCFAVARDAAGFAERSLELPANATAGEALAALVAAAPALSPHAGRLALAVNLEYVDRSHVLHDGDELALIPPVSGGSGSLSRVRTGEGWGEGERRSASHGAKALHVFVFQRYSRSPSP